jgi:Fe-S cluster assembly ATP-binding protein
MVKNMNRNEEKILEIKDFNVTVEDKRVINGLNLTINKGETLAIMGPNGSGKSTLAYGLMGHPKYVVKGSIIMNDEDISALSPDERSKKGLFLSFQNPIQIPGVTVSNFLRTAVNSRLEKPMRLIEFNKLLTEKMELLHIPKEFASRYLNEGFSGGEKKKMEILQLAMLNPKIAILDETDSGLDIDALKKVCESIVLWKEKNPELTLIIITHYQRMLHYLKPDRVAIMMNGQIVKQGTHELVDEIEKKGYEVFR